ncbi:uncharacterized protein C8R40DRAFT_1101437 [Lentinula edodes]|uniref:uncharacterized protein n=1 Tax=Lentinula edodes TaxID=5353 RepID=UPI001E8E49EE|nr:uncharacterized protein C8R40DRAFT_1101437 [Lentinula edodes]KAH7875836.1 hypothetical protein C8R40DRAFT_1101437 [Lentinula edodes]
MDFRPIQRKFFPYDDRAHRLDYREFTQFHGRRKPPRFLGAPGDIYINEKAGSLHVHLDDPQGWSLPWDGSFKNRIPHPLYQNRYLWIVDSRLEFSSNSIIQLPKNKFFLRDYKKVLKSVIDSSKVEAEIDLPTASESPAPKRKHSSVDDYAASNDCSSVCASNSKRSRVLVVSPLPATLRNSVSPTRSRRKDVHDSFDSFLAKSVQCTPLVNNDGLPIRPGIKTAESHVDANHSKIGVVEPAPISALSFVARSGSEVRQDCSQPFSEPPTGSASSPHILPMSSGPIHLSPVNQYSSLPLPKIHAFSEREFTDDSAETELSEDEVDELFSDEGDLNSKLDEEKAKNDSKGFRSNPSTQTERSSCSTEITKETDKLECHKDTVEERRQGLQASNRKFTPIIIESDDDDTNFLQGTVSKSTNVPSPDAISNGRRDTLTDPGKIRQRNEKLSSFIDLTTLDDFGENDPGVMDFPAGKQRIQSDSRGDSPDIVDLSLEEYQANVQASQRHSRENRSLNRKNRNSGKGLKSTPSPQSSAQLSVASSMNGQNPNAVEITNLESSNLPAAPTFGPNSPSFDTCVEPDLWPQKWHLRLLYRKDIYSSSSVICACCDTNARKLQRQNLPLCNVVSFPKNKAYEHDMLQHARDKHRESYTYINIVRMSSKEVDKKISELRAQRKR